MLWSGSACSANGANASEQPSAEGASAASDEAGRVDQPQEVGISNWSCLHSRVCWMQSCSWFLKRELQSLNRVCSTCSCPS
eukprot:3338263-Amphidinium_carterae.2